MAEFEIDEEATRTATLPAPTPSLGARVWLFWNEIHNSCLAPKDDGELRRLDARPLVVLLVAAVSLMIIRFAGRESVFATFYPPPDSAVIRSTNWELWSMAWWSGWSLIGYVLLPVIAIRCLQG